jgi:hypothetical protein
MGTLNVRASALQRAIGRPAVTALAAHFPGQRIYVPWSSQDAMDRFMDNFEPLIGAAGVAALFDQFGGLRIIVPSRTTPLRFKGYVAVDMERVAELTAVGKLTASQIAKLLRCDPRSVHKARTRAIAAGILKPKPTRRRRKVAA